MQDYIVGFLDGYKGVKLYYKFYTVKDNSARIIFLHGSGEYSEKYSRLAEWFAQRRIDVFMPDMRGHGRSGGPVCHVNDFNEYAFDLDIIARFIDRGWGHKKTFVVTHSLGSLISIFYALNFSYSFDGFIPCSPCLKVRLKVEPLKIWMAVMLYKFFGDKPFASHIKPLIATHDKYIIENFIKDPLIHHFVTASFYVQLRMAMVFIKKHASDFKSPVLILQAGDDKICDAKAVENFYNDISSPDKEFKMYKSFYHELLNETSRDIVFEDIYIWIKARC